MARDLPLTFRGRVVGSAEIFEDGAIVAQVDTDLLSTTEKIELFWQGFGDSLNIEVETENSHEQA